MSLVPSDSSLILVDARTTARVFILPPLASSLGRILIFKDYYGVSYLNTITIQTQGNDLIDDYNTQYILSNLFSSVTLIGDGLTSWRVMARYITVVPYPPTNLLLTINSSTGIATIATLGVTGDTTLNQNLQVTGVTTATKFVGNGTIPIGGIIMWSGSVAAIPTGWALCNGANGTPNLLDRFIVGAGSGYAVAGTGGSADATLVSHSHTATSTVSDPGHDHDWGYEDGQIGSGSRAGGSATFFTRSRRVQANFTGVTVGTTISTEGASATNANLPPFYALAFIMRTV